MDTVRKIAFKDISNYIKENNIAVYDNNYDVWYVTPSKLCDKETSILNRKLNIHSINKQKAAIKRLCLNL